MPIDPPPPLPDHDSPSENFIGLTVEDRVWDAQMYPLLTQGLRDADAAGTELLRRLLQRPEELVAHFQQKVWTLPSIIDYRKTPDSLLDYLRWHVGFGGTGSAAKFASTLTNDELRTLIKVAVRFWKTKGIRYTLINTIRFFATGVSPQVDDFFYMQALFDEVLWGFEEGPGTDFWMLYTPETAPSGSLNDANYVAIRIADTGSINRTLIESILELQRPASVRFEIAYVDFLDTFIDGRLGHWLSVGAGLTTYVPPDSSTDPVQLPGFRFALGDRERVDVSGAGSWRRYTWRSIVYLEDSNSCRIHMRYLVQDDDNCYYFRIDTSTNVVTLWLLVAGAPTLLATSAALIIPKPAPIAVWVETTFEGSGDPNYHRLSIDGEPVLTHSGDTTYRTGTVEVEHFQGTGSFVLARTELFQSLPDIVTLGP